MKGHKQSLDRENKENVDIDMHKYKNQVIQSMQEGNKLRFVIKVHKQNTKEIFYLILRSLFRSFYKSTEPIVQNFSPGEARKAFGLYLGYILRKISQSNADPACCDLVMKFLQHSSCSLRTPFLFTVCVRYETNSFLYCRICKQNYPAGRRGATVIYRKLYATVSFIETHTCL